MTLIRVYLRALSFLSAEAGLAAALTLANFALAGAQFAEPVLFGRIIDTLTAMQSGKTPPSWSEIGPLLAAWVGFGLFIIVCSVVVALHADKLAHRRRQALLTRYFEHILQLPLSYHGEAHSGRLMKIMSSGTDALWTLWLEFFRDYAAAVLSLAILLPLAIYISPPLGLLLIFVCLVFSAATTLVVSRTELMQRSIEGHYTDMAERASDALGNVALIQGFSRVEAEVSGLHDVTQRLLTAQMPVLAWWAAMSGLTRAGTTLTVLAIFVIGIWLHFQGKLTIGEIVMFISFATLLIGQLEKVVRFVNRILMEGPRLREFFDVLDTEPVRDKPGAADPGRLHGRVEFEQVSFSYDGKRAAVADLSFVAQPGETIALVGSTGAGKTTALALLHRAFDPQSGCVKIDGTDIRDYTLSGLRKNISVVFQETLLLNRSVAENLQVAKPDATEAEMRNAAARAQALNFIERHPDGLNARVGERGRHLSGGERQRLSIARALLKDPPILILDEATSALDADTEAKVQAALTEVMKNRTTFVIAHRLSTIRNADRVLVFEGGHIVETGTFDELVKFGGRLAQLARQQFLAPPAPETAPPPPLEPVET